MGLKNSFIRNWYALAYYLSEIKFFAGVIFDYINVIIDIFIEKDHRMEAS